MPSYTAVVVRDEATGFYVGYVPGWPGAHTQAETLDELHRNLGEVLSLLLEVGTPTLESVCIGTQTIEVLGP